MPEPISGGCKPDFHVTQIYVLLCQPKIVVGLHGKPGLGRSPEPFRKAKGPFRTDPAGRLTFEFQDGNGFLLDYEDITNGYAPNGISGRELAVKLGVGRDKVSALSEHS